MKLRVVLTVPSLDDRFGGPLEKVRGLTLALQRLGVDAIAVGCGSAPWAVGIPALARFHGTPVPARPEVLARLLKGADIVHIVGYRDPLGGLAASISRSRRLPFIVEPAGMYRRRGRSMALKRATDPAFRRLFGTARMWIGTSQLEAHELTDEGIAPEKIQLRPNGVDLGQLLPLPSNGTFREAVGIPADARLILVLGRVARVKNIPSIMRAAAPLGAWLAIVGPDAGDGALEEVRWVAAETGIAERVRFVSAGLWGREKGAAFADSDCLCLASWTENFGNSAAEAAAVGVPVVVSETAGVAEWLPEGLGFETPPADVDHIRSALAAAMTARARRTAASAAASVRLQLGWDAIADRQRQLYVSVL